MHKTTASRRAFLKKGLASFGLLSLSPALTLAEKLNRSKVSGIYIGGGRYKETIDGKLKYLLSKITTYEDGSNEIEVLSSPIFPHGFATDPNNKYRLVAFTKIGPKAAIYDLDSWKVIKKLSAKPGRLFYGHGVFSKDGNLLYSTETDIANSKGYIGIRDAKTLKYLGDFPSYGDHPHDCKLVDNGNTLIVTNGGGNSASGRLANLSYIDIRSQKLIKQLPVTDGRFNAGHVETDVKGNALLISAPRRGLNKKQLGAIHISKSSNSLTKLSQPQVTDRITGEALSARIIPEHNLLIVTHPTPGIVTCWALDSLKNKKVIRLAHARGVALNSDKSEFIISYGRKVAVKRFKSDSLKEIKGSTIENTGISGSHLINWQTFQRG